MTMIDHLDNQDDHFDDHQAYHDDDSDHQAYYDGKNYDHRSIEQLRREAGLARPTRGNDDDDDNYGNYDDDNNSNDDSDNGNAYFLKASDAGDISPPIFWDLPPNFRLRTRHQCCTNLMFII